MVTLPSPKQVHPLYEILQRCGKELVTREAPISDIGFEYYKTIYFFNSYVKVNCRIGNGI